MKCFISYSWDSESHKDWVRSLAAKLQTNGIETYLDQWDISGGKDLPNYMETCIRECNFVLLICTPKFAQKANKNIGGVGYEKAIVTGELFQKSVLDIKFIPILKEGNPDISLPSYLKSKAYISFIKSEYFDSAFEELLRTIYKKPLYQRPPLGTTPKLDSVIDDFAIPIISKSIKNKHQEKIAIAKSSSLNPIQDHSKIYHFAYNTINKTSASAESFATNWLKNHSNKDFENFKEAYKFGYNTINKTTSSAETFAFKWLENNSDKGFEVFKAAYKFGYNTINKTTSSAEVFAFKWIENYPNKDFENFKAQYNYAYNTLNKTTTSAEKFSFDNI